MKWCPRPAFALASCILALHAVCAWSGTPARVRLMLNVEAAGSVELTAERLEALRALAGVSLEPSGRTRTGAVEFTLPEAVGADEAAIVLRRLRGDRSVLWAETATDAAVLKT